MQNSNSKKTSQKLITTTIFLIVIFFAPYLIRPKEFTGDEPHYLLAFQSVLTDHDLQLTNNYNSLTKANRLSDHHTVFIKADTAPIPWRNAVARLCLQRYSERPIHPIIYILLYSFFIIPFVPLLGIVQSVLLVCHLIAIISFVIFYRIAKKYLTRKNALYATLFLAFGTSFWFYANSAYPEIFLAFLLLAGIYLLLENKWYLLLGLLSALAVCIKFSYILLPLLVIIWLVKEKRLKQLALFIPGFIFTIILYLILNKIIYNDPLFLSVTGNPFHPILTVINKYALEGLFGILLNRTTGLFVFTPLLVFSIIETITGIYKSRRIDIISILPYGIVVIYAFWAVWGGGYSFSYRLILPVVPFFVLLAFIYLQSEKRDKIRIIFFALTFYSVAIQFVSVMMPVRTVISQPPYIFQFFVNKLEGL